MADVSVSRSVVAICATFSALRGGIHLVHLGAEQQVLVELAQRAECALHVDHQVLYLPVGLLQ